MTAYVEYLSFLAASPPKVRPRVSGGWMTILDNVTSNPFWYKDREWGCWRCDMLRVVKNGVVLSPSESDHIEFTDLPMERNTTVIDLRKAKP